MRNRRASRGHSLGPAAGGSGNRYTDVTAVPDGFVVAATRAVETIPTAIGQRFDMQGAVVGSAFELNPADPSFSARIGADRNGRLVAAWQTGAPSFFDSQVFARRFDSDGTGLGDAFMVNAYTTKESFYANVAVAPDGNFLVVWQEVSGDINVLGQRYDSGGNALGAETPLSESTTQSDLRPTVTALDDGTFIVAWVRGSELRGRRVLPDGLGDEVQLADTIANSRRPSISALGSSFAASWISYVDYLHGNLDSDLWTGTFDANGTPLGARNAISVGVPAVRPRSLEPAIASDGRGFVVVWSSATYYEGYPGQFGHLGPTRLNGARIDLEGTRTDEFDVALDNDRSASQPHVAAHGDGTFMVVWNSYSRVFCDTAGRELGCGTTRCLGFPHDADVTDVSASDALVILQAATGVKTCPACVCDVDSSGQIASSDALAVLRKSVGVDTELACPAC